MQAGYSRMRYWCALTQSVDVKDRRSRDRKAFRSGHHPIGPAVDYMIIGRVSGVRVKGRLVPISGPNPSPVR